MNGELLGTRILVNPTKDPDKDGDIYLPEKSQQKPSSGVVVKVGGKVEGVKAGDTVLFSKWMNLEVTLHGRLFLIVEEADVLVRWPGGTDAGLSKVNK